MNKKVLLVDDERDIVEFLEYNLVQEGFDVITAFDGAEALQKIHDKPDLVILDIMMPKMDGYEVCKKLRNMPEFKDIPVIFLTAKGDEIDEVKGLSIGGDDYIQKPVSPKRIIARVKSNLRRSENLVENDISENEITVGPLKINREKYTVLIDGENVVFPKKEFEIITYLAVKPGKVFPREKNS
jgi:two-component system alkaline phosphatase synthesis response regulator PhoP